MQKGLATVKNCQLLLCGIIELLVAINWQSILSPTQIFEGYKAISELLMTIKQECSKIFMLASGSQHLFWFVSTQFGYETCQR